MGLAEFFEAVDRLKRVKRSGWLERGVKGAESSADHSFAVALQALVLGHGRTDLDMQNVLRMALVHDLAECVVGDIISKESWPEGGSMVAKEKHALEKRALKGVLSSLAPDLKKELMAAWEEFEEGKTKDAAFVKSIDKLETIVHALQYAKAGNFRKPMAGFWDKTAMRSIKDAEVRRVLSRILKQAGAQRALRPQHKTT